MTIAEIKNLVKRIIREEKEESNPGRLAWDLIDAIEGDMDDTPGIEDFFRRKGITSSQEKKEILRIAGKLIKNQY